MAAGDLGQGAPPLEDNRTNNAKRNYLPSWAASKLPASMQPKRTVQSAARPHDKNQDYLTGLRGVLVPMAFLWMFLQTFVPAAVKGSLNTTGPAWQLALRKSLSVLFWNDTLIYGSIIFLSARSICLPFLLEPTKVVLASSVFRRGIRLWFPVAVALIVCYAVFTRSLGGNQYLYDFAGLTENVSMNADMYIMPNSLSNFNSIFDIFWITHNFQTQAGNWAFPTQTLWVISAVFQQSYTVYMTMVIIPYTRLRWRVMGAFVFILTAWWVYSWAWYSVTALLIADMVINMDLRPDGTTSLTVGKKFRVPYWIIGAVLMVGGFAMQFIWVAWRPDLMNSELYYHTGLYSTGGINYGVDVTTDQIRADCYLIILGFHLILECSSLLQSILRSRFLVMLGKRSFSECTFASPS
jgi:hypothetical protein